MTILQPSCDALDLAPEDYYGAGNFWKEASQPKAFMLGLHAQLRSYYDMFYTLGELRGGTQRVGTSSLNTSLNYADIRSQNISEDIPGISNWNGLYSPIMQVNHFIQEVENGCTFLDDATRSRYLGQAYGMRALYYFMLYRTFGGSTSHHQSRYTGRQTIGRQILCGARHTRSHHGVYQSGY